MNPYKCKDHKLDLACLRCIKSWIARHDKMLQFIKSLAHESCYETYENSNEINWVANELLQELGLNK